MLALRCSVEVFQLCQNNVLHSSFNPNETTNILPVPSIHYPTSNLQLPTSTPPHPSWLYLHSFLTHVLTYVHANDAIVFGYNEDLLLILSVRLLLP